MVFLCYIIGLGLNILWLLMGDELSTAAQMAIPVLSVMVGGMGVFLRTRHLGTRGKAAYRRRAMWVLLIYYLAILSVLLFFGGLFHVDRAWGTAVNLEPFNTIRRFFYHYRRTGAYPACGICLVM